jgi:hypothetical protein
VIWKHVHAFRGNPDGISNSDKAVEHYRGRTVRLLSCVTGVHVVVCAYHLSDAPHELELADTAAGAAAGALHEFEPLVGHT